MVCNVRRARRPLMNKPRAGMSGGTERKEVIMADLVVIAIFMVSMGSIIWIGKLLEGMVEKP
jgi:hypothetical protein